MKTLRFFFIIVFTASYSLLLAQNQTNTQINDFKIAIKKTINGIQIKSLNEGTAWTQLSFKYPDDLPVTISPYGMTYTKNEVKNENDQSSSFLFTLTKTNEEIILKGIKGTHWKKLTFNVPQDTYQIITPFGLL